MTARRKRSALSRKKKSQRKRNKAEAVKQKEDQPTNLPMESYRLIPSKYVWKPKRPCYGFEVIKDRNALIPMQPINNSMPHFYNAERLAEWVFRVAKIRPLQLNLDWCERSEEVRDALLRQFHRWPETKISQSAEQCKTLSQQAEQECHEQVQLYLQELRGKLLGGAKALFWLNILQPLIHPASVPRDEVREVLMALLEELKGIEGIYEHLMKKSERIWAVLTLPFKLEPLFRGVSMLALWGHNVAANEAMELLTIFAEQYTASPDQKKRRLPVGLSVVASVGTFAPPDTSSLSDLLDPFSEQLAKPLAMMVPDWIAVVEEVLDVLEKSLICKWMSCGKAPFEEEFNMSVQSDLEKAFERLSHALAADQLYAMRKDGGERANADEECLNVSIVRQREVLLVQCTVKLM